VIHGPHAVQVHGNWVDEIGFQVRRHTDGRLNNNGVVTEKVIHPDSESLVFLDGICNSITSKALVAIILGDIIRQL
jgi:hypothetical protein